MSAPIDAASLSQASWYLVPGMVLAASLLGSTHCMGMCGGISLALPPRKEAQTAYHLGRLAGYLLLGGLAGLAGRWLLASSPVLSVISAGLMAFMLMYTAVRVWRGEGLHLNLPGWLRADGLLARVLPAARGGALPGWLAGGLTGLLTIFLPCGWLYTYVIGALATHHPVLGALYLGSFWLGTVPMLAWGPALLGKLLVQRPRQRHWVAGLFLVAGLLTLVYKAGLPMPIRAENLTSGKAVVACPHHPGMLMEAP